MECLYALKADPQVHEIIIVDNGNPPAMREWLARFCEKGGERIRLIGLANPGFGAGVNRAALEARQPFLLVINPDCVLRTGSVADLITALETVPEARLAGGRIFGIDGRELRGARRRELTLSRALGLSRWTLEDQPLPASPLPVDAVSGAFFMMRRSDFAALGGFDEGYFLHVEDLDLCRRVREAGGEVVFQPSAGALHYGSTSDVEAGMIAAHKARSLARYFRKFSRSPAQRCLAELLIPFIRVMLVLRRKRPRPGPGP